MSGVEMGLRMAGVPHKTGGAAAALDSLVESRRGSHNSGGEDEMGPAPGMQKVKA